MLQLGSKASRLKGLSGIIMATTKNSPDYRELSNELDDILESLQTSELDIDKAIRDYERGMIIVKQLDDYLKSAENKITKIKTRFDGID